MQANTLLILYTVGYLWVVFHWILMWGFPNKEFSKKALNSPLFLLGPFLAWAPMAIPDLPIVIPNVLNLPYMQEGMGLPTMSMLKWWQEFLALPSSTLSALLHMAILDIFVGRWIYFDSFKLKMNRPLSSVVLVLTSVAAPLGLFIYVVWRMRKNKSFKIDAELT